MRDKPRLSIFNIINMSVGFFGIQFGWGLQMGNMSAIYEFLGAKEDELPLLWLAAPLTGLIVQPIIGYMSDRTWTVLGRRRPYFLVGAILSSIALILMPQSSALWMAAGLLWILDASVNISMEPFRAFVSDLLPEQQRTVGFAMQSAFIGAGAVLAALLPGWLAEYGVSTITGPDQPIPQTIHVAFTVGGVVFLAAVLWTIGTCKEYPPDESESQRNTSANDFIDAIANIPKTMWQLGAVQFFTWMGLFCMWIFFSVGVARDFKGAIDTDSSLYKEGLNLANACFAVQNLAGFVTAIHLIYLGRVFSAKLIHIVALVLGGVGLIATGITKDEFMLQYICFLGVGIAWASILSMPYAMLSNAIPAERTGVYMGIFNFFIVIPQILVAIILSRVLAQFESLSRLNMVMFGGGCFLFAAILTLFVDSKEKASIEQL
jgi:maltose/moltooligosaccharide transporter